MKGTSPSRASSAQNGNSVPRWEVLHLINSLEGEIMPILTVGIDLTKNVFAVHGANETGKAELNVSLPDGVIGMEACSD